MARKPLQSNNNQPVTEAEALFRIADESGDRLAWRVAKLALKMEQYRARRARKAAKQK